jgi:hypothetical protein
MSKQTVIVSEIQDVPEMLANLLETWSTANALLDSRIGYHIV